MNEEAVRVLYTNYKGQTNYRVIVPRRMWFGVCLFYGDAPQWLLEVYDMEKKEMRTFSMANVRDWVPLTEYAANLKRENENIQAEMKREVDKLHKIIKGDG